MTSGRDGELLGHFEYVKDDSDNAERKGRAMATKIVDKLREIDGEEAIVGIMADSTKENTGHNHGTIRATEEKMDKNLVWVICSLHTLERQLR